LSGSVFALFVRISLFQKMPTYVGCCSFRNIVTSQYTVFECRWGVTHWCTDRPT